MFFFLMPFLPELYIGQSDLKFFDIIFRGKVGGVLTEATRKEDVEVYKYLFQKWSEYYLQFFFFATVLRCHSLSDIAYRRT